MLYKEVKGKEKHGPNLAGVCIKSILVNNHNKQDSNKGGHY